MTTLMPDLQKSLARTAQNLDRTAKYRSRRWRIAVATTVGGFAVAGVATAAVTDLWRPAGPELGGRTVVVDPTPPPAAQLELLGVLRRPADAADRGARSLAALRYSPDQVRTNSVRLVARTDSSGGFAIVPIRAKSEDSPAGGRAETLRDPICLVLPAATGGGGTCQTTTQIAAGNMVLSTEEKVYGVVPDGVAAVRRTDTSTGQPATATVVDNAFVLPAFGLQKPSIEWLDGNGDVVAKVDASPDPDATMG